MSKSLWRTLLCGACFALSPLAAEAQEAVPAEVIHWWTSGGEAAAVKVIADRFDAAGGKWVDNAVAGTDNARAAAVNRIVGGNPPAASQFNTGRQFDDLVGQGLLADLSGVAVAEGWAKVIPGPIAAAATRNGKFFAVPINIHGQNWLFYNKDVFAKAGIQDVPTSFDALFAALDKLKAAGVVPVAWGGQAWQEEIVFEAVLLGQGGKDLFLKVFRDHDLEAVHSPRFREAVEVFARMKAYVDPGSPGRAWNDATAMVIAGHAGLQIMGDWAKGEFNAAGMAPGGPKVGCSLMPGKPGYLMGGDVFVFPKLGPGATPTAAQALLAKTMLDPVTQLEFNKRKGSIPVRIDVDTSSMDPCAQVGIAMVRDPANQVPSNYFLLTADTLGAVQDAVTEFWNTPGADAKSFVETFAGVIRSAH